MTLSDLAKALQAPFSGPANLTITRPVPAGYDDPEGITFAGNESYLKLALESDVAAIIVPMEAPELDKPVIKVPNPRAAFAMVLHLMSRPMPLNSGIHPTALVDSSATIGENVSIGPYVVVESGAVIGANSKVYAHGYIGENCKLGEGVMLYPRVTLYQDVRLGDGCIVHSGAVIGADGFGFVWDGEVQRKIPQVGGVIIGKNVEIGANTCIDRATSGETRVADGTKLDNLIQVGHNVKIGEDTVVAAIVGIGGSTEIGSRVTVGGQAGFADHVKVADDVVLAGRTGVIGNIDQAGQFFGLPPVPVKQAMRSMALQQRLPDLFQRMRALEREIEELKNGQDLS